MHPVANTKSVFSIMGTGVTNGATVTANIDRLGYNFVSIDAIFSASNNATNNPSTLKLSHSDTTDATNYSDITEYVGDGAGGFTIANVTTAVHGFRFNVDARRLKRHIKLTATPVTTQDVVMAARLARGEENADRSASAMGVVQIVAGS